MCILSQNIKFTCMSYGNIDNDIKLKYRYICIVGRYKINYCQALSELLGDFLACFAAS